MFNPKRAIALAAAAVALTAAGGTGVASAHSSHVGGPLTFDEAYRTALNVARNDAEADPAATAYGVRQCDRMNDLEFNCVGSIDYTNRPTCNFTIDVWIDSYADATPKFYDSPNCDR